MIRVNNLTVSYQQKRGRIEALNNINLNIISGETCALIGPSGCGKTTLLYSLAGLIEPDRGEILIGGEDIEEKRREIAVILQEYGLLPWKNVWNNVILGLKLRGNRLQEYKKRVEDLLEELEIANFKDHYPTELSGGQRQRVAIARALTLNPRLLLMDEPFSSLDALTREQIQNLFLNIWHKYRMTAVLVTHSIEEAVFLGQKIVVLSNRPGKIVDVIENSHFAREDWRGTSSFYQQCQRIRGLLQEGVK